jgi:RecA-family ATPase
MDQDHEPQRVDVIPGVLRRQRVCTLTGMPGQGKSLMVLQSALALACGVNPFTLKPAPCKRTLYVQLENEPDEEQDRIEGMLSGRWGKQLDESLVDVQVRTGGIDLTTSPGRAWLRGLVRTWQPDLVCIGPYKNMHAGIAPVGASDRHAALAKAIQQPLDQIRREFGCAFLIEAHPTREADRDSDNPMDFLPAGGSEMERWTALGLCLMGTEKAGTYRLGAWREPRRHHTDLPGGMVRRDGPGWVWAPNDARYTTW